VKRFSLQPQQQQQQQRYNLNGVVFAAIMLLQANRSFYGR